MNSKEFLKNLKVTQFSLRYTVEQLRWLIDDATNGYFTNKNKIAIIDTKDGNFWIRDGLHRCVAILKSGRDLHASEFAIEYFNYSDMNSINLSVKYYTPFDLKSEVRLTDLSKFRTAVDNIKPNGFTLNVDNMDEKRKKFILENPHLYKTAKMAYHESLLTFTNHFFNKT